MTGRKYQDLQVWNESMALVDARYAATRNWPREEMLSIAHGSLREVETLAMIALRQKYIEDSLTPK